MSEKPQNLPYFFQTGKKDILDIMDTYRYMNSSMLSELFIEDTWDHGTGWVQLNYSAWDWRHRQNEELPSPFPEAPPF